LFKLTHSLAEVRPRIFSLARFLDVLALIVAILDGSDDSWPKLLDRINMDAHSFTAFCPVSFSHLAMITVQ
jgi:hypothetical protein